MSKAYRMFEELKFTTDDGRTFSKHLGDGIYISIEFDYDDKSYVKRLEKGWERTTIDFLKPLEVETVYTYMKELGWIK